MVPVADGDTVLVRLTVLLTLGDPETVLLTVAVRVLLPLTLPVTVADEVPVGVAVHDTVTVTDAEAVMEAVKFADLVTVRVGDRDGVLDGVAVMVVDGVGTQVPVLATSSSHVGLVPFTAVLPATLST